MILHPEQEKTLDAFVESYLAFADVRLATLKTLATTIEKFEKQADKAQAKRKKAAAGAAESQAVATAKLQREHLFVTNMYMILHQLEMPAVSF